MRLEVIQVIEIPESSRSGEKEGIGSLDICVEDGKLYLVAGVNVGKMIETRLTFLDKPETSGRMFETSFVTLVSCHASHNFQGADKEYTYLFRKKVLMAVHPTHFVFVSVGSDRMLQVIDFENHVLLEEINLTTYLNGKEDNCIPTCVKFSRKGESLITRI